MRGFDDGQQAYDHHGAPPTAPGTYGDVTTFAFDEGRGPVSEAMYTTDLHFSAQDLHGFLDRALDDYSPTPRSTTYEHPSTYTSTAEPYHSHNVDTQGNHQQTYSFSGPSRLRSHSSGPSNTSYQDNRQTQVPRHSYHRTSQAQVTGANFTYHANTDDSYGAYQEAAGCIPPHSPQSPAATAHSAASYYGQDPYIGYTPPIAIPHRPHRAQSSNARSDPTHNQSRTAYFQQQDQPTYNTANYFTVPSAQNPYAGLPSSAMGRNMARQTSRSRGNPRRRRNSSPASSPRSSGSNEMHACRDCDASFKRSADLVRHRMGIHGENVIFLSCDFPNCNRVGTNGFKRKDHLTDHKRSVHDQQIPKRAAGQRSVPRPATSPGSEDVQYSQGGYAGYDTVFMD